jgi:hypothetical protein
MEKINYWTRFKRGFTSDKKRYGIQLKPIEKVITWTILIGAIAALFAGLYQLDNKNNTSGYLWSTFTFALMMYWWMFYSVALYRRIRELGGDVFHPLEKK